MSPEMQYLWIMVKGHLARTHDDERGVSAVEWIFITIALIGMALAVGIAITGKIESKANGISL